MAATNIGSSKYPLAKIPAMVDPADIQVALKYYHWGQNTEPEGTATAGISKYLDDIDTRIDTIDTTINNIVNKTIIDAKGDLIVGTGDNAVDNLARGSDGHYLVADETQIMGLKWQALPSATTSVSGIVQLSDTGISTSTTQAATANSVRVLKQTVDVSAKTADYTIAATDAGKTILMNVSSGTSVLTIPVNPSAPNDFPDYTRIDIIQTGSVQTSVAGAVGVTLNSRNSHKKLSGQYSAATIIKTGANEWVLIGDLTI